MKTVIGNTNVVNIETTPVRRIPDYYRIATGQVSIQQNVFDDVSTVIGDPNATLANFPSQMFYVDDETLVTIVEMRSSNSDRFVLRVFIFRSTKSGYIVDFFDSPLITGPLTYYIPEHLTVQCRKNKHLILHHNSNGSVFLINILTKTITTISSNHGIVANNSTRLTISENDEYMVLTQGTGSNSGGRWSSIYIAFIRVDAGTTYTFTGAQTAQNTVTPGYLGFGDQVFNNCPINETTYYEDRGDANTYLYSYNPVTNQISYQLLGPAQSPSVRVFNSVSFGTSLGGFHEGMSKRMGFPVFKFVSVVNGIYGVFYFRVLANGSLLNTNYYTQYPSEHIQLVTTGENYWGTLSLWNETMISDCTIINFRNGFNNNILTSPYAGISPSNNTPNLTRRKVFGDGSGQVEIYLTNQSNNNSFPQNRIITRFVEIPYLE